MKKCCVSKTNQNGTSDSGGKTIGRTGASVRCQHLLSDSLVERGKYNVKSNQGRICKRVGRIGKGVYAIGP